MNKIVTGVLMMATVSLMACGASDTPEVDKSLMPSDTGKTTIAPANAASDIAPTTITTNPLPGTQAAPGQVISSAQPAAVPTGAGLNPAHGAPGHDCAIPVGAPLNSAPTAPKPQVQTAPTNISVPAPVSAPAPSVISSGTTAAGMNPPHGQPGHDCAIAVGAPLKKG